MTDHIDTETLLRAVGIALVGLAFLVAEALSPR